MSGGGTFLQVQWLRYWASVAGNRCLILVGDLRSCMLHCLARKKKKHSQGDPVLYENVCALEKETLREDYPRGIPLRSVFLDHQGTWVKMNVLTS